MANATPKRKSSRDYLAALAEAKETPWGYLLKIIEGKVKKPNMHIVRACKELLPYTLPRLQSIEAENTNINRSHEEALDELDGLGSGDADEDEEAVRH